MFDYFRRLKFTAKVLVISLLSTLFFFLINIILNTTISLNRLDIGNQLLQVFSLIDLFFTVSLLIFGVFGFYFLISELVNIPYNEHKLEVAMTIFMVLTILLAIPATLTVDQFQLYHSYKVILDIVCLLTGAIYIVMATAIFYLPETNYVISRYIRWSIFVFIVFFGVLVLETMRIKVESLTLWTFVGAYLLGILLIFMKDIQILFDNQNKQKNLVEIILFIIVSVGVILYKMLTIF